MREGHKFSDKTPNRSKRSHEAIHCLRNHSHNNPLHYCVKSQNQLLIPMIIKKVRKSHKSNMNFTKPHVCSLMRPKPSFLATLVEE